MLNNNFLDFENRVIRSLEHIIQRQAKSERDNSFNQHMIRKIAAKTNVPVDCDDVEIDVVSRYVPCYSLQAVRDLELKHSPRTVEEFFCTCTCTRFAVTKHVISQRVRVRCRSCSHPASTQCQGIICVTRDEMFAH